MLFYDRRWKRCVMSMKKLAVLSAYHNYGLNDTRMNPTPGSPPQPVHGVNVMLGGAMISGIILIVFIFCYCCHKTHRKSQTHLPPYWREPGLSMEIYTVEAPCFRSGDVFMGSEESHRRHSPATPPGPPPAYDMVVVPIEKSSDEFKNGDEEDDEDDDAGLPSYETAVKLQVTGQGYV